MKSTPHVRAYFFIVLTMNYYYSGLCELGTKGTVSYAQ